MTGHEEALRRIGKLETALTSIRDFDYCPRCEACRRCPPHAPTTTTVRDIARAALEETR